MGFQQQSTAPTRTHCFPNAIPRKTTSELAVMLTAWRGRRHPTPLSMAMRKQEEKSEGWIVDGEIHGIGDHVPPRERFVIPRDNIPNKRRKRLRDQFMRRSRLVLKETEHEPWCKRYIFQNLNSRRQPNVHDMNSRRQPFDAQRYFSDSERERRRTTNGLCTYICTRQEAWKGAAFAFHLFLNCHRDDF